MKSSIFIITNAVLAGGLIVIIAYMYVLAFNGCVAQQSRKNICIVCSISLEIHLMLEGLKSTDLIQSAGVTMGQHESTALCLDAARCNCRW